MLIVGAYLASELSRGFAHSTADTAIGHAHDVVSIEKHVGLFHEAGVQSFAHSVPGLSTLLGYSYVSLHTLVTVGVLAWAYRYHRNAYPLLRNALIVASTIAVLVAATVGMLARRPLVKAIAAAYPIFVLFVIVATGNHFLFDAAAGAAVAVVAMALVRPPRSSH